MNRLSVTLLLLSATVQPGWGQRRDRDRSRDRDRRAASVDAPHADTGEYSQDYAIFSSLNIFQRERHAPVSSKPAAPPKTLEQTYVLTGIVQDLDNVYRANFEDTSRGQVQKVSVGSVLAHGTISDIRQDQAAYEVNGKKVWVQIGSNLTGANAAPSDNTAASGGTPVDPNAPGLTIEQRMRARRQAQMTGGAGPTISSSTPPASGSPPPGVSSPPFGTARPATPGGPSRDVTNEPPQVPGDPSNGQPPGDVGEPSVVHNFPPLPTAAPNGSQPDNP